MSPHLGRGGWTWYTGSASWMYRAGLESILGFHIVDGKKLRLSPCIPTHWHGFQIKHRFGSSNYLVDVKNPLGVSVATNPTIKVDGNSYSTNFMGDKDCTGFEIELIDDKREHTINFEMA